MKWLMFLVICFWAQSVLAAPFTVQAPGGDWKDPRLQDGCEEAAALMAYGWVNRQTNLGDAVAVKRQLLALADWQIKNHKQAVDTSAQDTAERLLKDYFQLSEVAVEQKVTLRRLVEIVSAGDLVLAPTDGRKLKNPFYTPPGPTTHMLVLIGYDAKRKEFITNDSGTKRGQNYRYPEKRLYAALADYPTGRHLPRKSIEKNIIIVKRPYAASQK